MKKKSTMGRVMSYFAPLKWRIAVVIFFGIVSITLYSFMPSLTADALAAIEFNAGMIAVVKPLILYLLLCLFSEGFSLVCKFFIIKFEYKITAEQLDVMRRKLDVVPLSFIDKFEVGDTTRRVANGVKLYKECLCMVYDLSRTIFFFIINIIAMLTMDPTLTLLVVTSLPIAIIIARIVAKKTQKFYSRNADIERDIYNFTEERSTLHGFFAENGIAGSDEFDAVNKTNGAIGVDTVVELNAAYIAFIKNFMYLAVTVVFGLLAINGTISPESFMILPAFLMYSSRFLSNSTIVKQVTNTIQSTTTTASVFYEVLDCPDDVTADEDTNIKKIDGSILFDNVSSEKVKDVSFEIPFGSTVAFIEDDSGTGSEIVEIMSKMVLPKEGQIKVNDIDLARLRSKNFYERIGVCYDRPFLIDASIAENIMYGVGKTLPENVIEVTSMFGFDEFIRTLPNGYSTRLTENSVYLTHAEQQAVNLCRTVLHSPDVLILNNALTNFDALSEKKHNESIIKKLKNRTRIFVTKRASTVQSVDKIYVCRGGKIVESGTHKELMQQKGVYYSMQAN